MIDKKTVEKVAKIARLELTEKEINKFSKDLSNITEAFKSLEKVDTIKVNPTFQPIEMKNVFREDVVEEGLSQSEALSQTKEKEDGYFKGPKVV